MNDTSTQQELTVYGAPWCPDCKRSKKFLAAQRVEYKWVDVDTDESGLRHVETVQNGGRSMPMVNSLTAPCSSNHRMKSSPRNSDSTWRLRCLSTT